MTRLQQASVGSVCELVKGGIDPQRYPNELFAHYSIPALDEGKGPAIEVGKAIRSQKTVIEHGIVLVSKLNPRIPRVWLVDDEQTCRRICSTEFVPLRPDPTRLELAYLAFAMRFALAAGQISGSTSAATKSRERAKPNDLLRLILPLPPLPEQRRIVDLLSRAEGIVRLRREAEKKAAELIPALFLDIFGDPATNPKGWAVEALDTVAQIISGATKGRRLDPEESVELPYMRVANVKDGYLDLADIKTIEVKRTEVEKYRLHPGDLLLTEGGDPDKLGRGALWAGAIETCLHQNHIFKVRADRTRLLPEYLCELVGSYYGKAYFLRVAKKTTGIATINRTQLGGFPVIIPPMGHQLEFAERIGGVRSIQAQQSAATAKAQATFDSLLSQAFS